MGRRTLAALSTLATLIVLTPSAAAQAPYVSPTGMAAEVTELTDALAALQQRRLEAESALTAVEQRITDLSTRVDAIDVQTAELVGEAERQAVATYVRGEPAAQPFALAAALSLQDVNDVAWALGVLRVSHRQSIDSLRAAKASRPTANTELTAAVAERAALRLELARVDPVIRETSVELTAAESQLDTFVLRMAPAMVEGLTTVVFDAYQRAAAVLAVERPECGLRWELLAAIGKTESNHGAGRIDINGNSIRRIVGIPIGPDSDDGLLDDDPARDRAAGPMQFIPTTWKALGGDGNGDGIADPHNIFDATVSAGRYLCRAAGALTLLTREGVIRAIWAYNPNDEYLRIVGARFEALAQDVANGWFSSADLPLPPAPAPPVDGMPPGIDGNQPPAPVDATPAPPPTPSTSVLTVTMFTADGLAVPTAGDPAAATCVPGSAVLAGRVGLWRCTTTPAEGGVAEALDPCQPAPFDGALLACLPDPEAPARLVRVAAPVAVAPVGPGPPYYALTLAGGDRCRPVAVVVTGTAGATLPGTTTTDAGTTTTAASTTTSTSTSTTTVAPTSTTAATTTTAAQPATTTIAPTTTTAAAPTPVAPGPADVTYRCTSGADIIGQPDARAEVWGVVVRQPGIVDRRTTVTNAWT